ncbi:MAG: class I SAM-dependent methyltransferase [Leptospirales bacterium]|nr:class I SAM-dependent methyltransferase [Leptospirales bacterium]
MRFNQSEYAEFYHKQQLEAGYPGKLLPFILDELKDSNSIIDIGSGTGFFTIPLAEAGHKVTSIEPSAEMINIMKRNSSHNILPLINISQSTWENWKGEFHDAAISVHSLYPMADIKESLNLINISAAKKIIIVRDSEKMKTITKIIREKFGIFTNIDLNRDIVLFLDERSIKYRVVNIYEERKHFINNIHQMADSVCYQLKLNESKSADVAEIIKDEIVSSASGDFFNTIYSDNVYVF